MRGPAAHKDMMRKDLRHSQRAFSMVEVIVAAVLFALASAGIFATISYTNRTVESNKRVQASSFAKKILDGLNKEVVGATWGLAGNLLTVQGPAYVVPADPDFPGCTASYTVANAGTARKVRLVVICP